MSTTKSLSRRSIRDIQREHTFDLLLQSAHDLFVENGYANTTIDQIATRAGASRATFYLHFERKWETVRHLYKALLEQETLDYYRRLDAFAVPTKKQIKSWLEDALGFYESHSEFLAVYRQASSLEPDLSKFQLENLANFVAVMPNYLKRWGSKRETEARLRLNLLTIQLSDIAMRLVQGDLRLDKELLVNVLLEYWLVGLKDPRIVKSL